MNIEILNYAELSAITSSWDTDSFTTWLLSMITIGWDAELFLLSEILSSLSIIVSELGEVLILLA